MKIARRSLQKRKQNHPCRRPSLAGPAKSTDNAERAAEPQTACWKSRRKRGRDRETIRHVSRPSRALSARLGVHRAQDTASSPGRLVVASSSCAFFFSKRAKVYSATKRKK